MLCCLSIPLVAVLLLYYAVLCKNNLAVKNGVKEFINKYSSCNSNYIVVTVYVITCTM